MDNAARNRLLLKGLEAGLGEKLERLCTDLRLPSRDKWKPDFAASENNWWDVAIIESGRPRGTPMSLSLTVDAARFDPAPGKTELDIECEPRGLALSVALEVGVPDRSQETLAENARHVAAILAAAFPGTLAGSAEKILAEWPSREVSRGTFPRLTLPQNDAVEWQRGSVLLFASSFPVDEPCEDPEAAGRKAASEILQQWEAFSEVTHYLRALYYPLVEKKASKVTDEELMGLLGEAVYAVRCGTEKTTWVGGGADLDFRLGERAVEVKTGVGSYPCEPFFSHGELRLGSSRSGSWDVALIALDKGGFAAARELLDGIKAKPRRASFVPEALSGRASEIAIERMSRSWGVEDDAAKEALRKVLKDLVRSKRTTIRDVERPFARQWKALTKDAVCVLGSEVRVAIDPRV